jgi:hypothetical protein
MANIIYRSPGTTKEGFSATGMTVAPAATIMPDLPEDDLYLGGIVASHHGQSRKKNTKPHGHAT